MCSGETIVSVNIDTFPEDACTSQYARSQHQRARDALVAWELAISFSATASEKKREMAIAAYVLEFWVRTPWISWKKEMTLLEGS